MALVRQVDCWKDDDGDEDGRWFEGGDFGRGEG